MWISTRAALAMRPIFQEPRLAFWSALRCFRMAFARSPTARGALWILLCFFRSSVSDPPFGVVNGTAAVTEMWPRPAADPSPSAVARRP
ncbi:hypothetical protein BL254_04930 [Protofrankia sp. BMG5.30]|uniref:Secreted protein n=1 Tax=Protofrankia coriariae TaxID=1562887 RepID=A0ABR5F607_9ACTN|nr:hypothetical protein FrCorBMG51_06595 [Protofrankia coriariae]ONH37011.1 hypothetical protein BL254_04930 [Protofrankia sp. BMG5.30]